LTGNGYLEVAGWSGTELTNGGTFYVLARPERTKGRLLDKCPVGGATGFTFDTHPGNALRIISDSGSVSYDAKSPAGEWVHLAATIDEQGNSVLYINGKPVASSKRAESAPDLKTLLSKAERIQRFYTALLVAGLAESYEAAHARLALRCLAAAHQRAQSLANGRLAPLPVPERSQAAADKLYVDTASKLCDGLEKALEASAKDSRVYALWKSTIP
jgi:hypothetical protein